VRLILNVIWFLPKLIPISLLPLGRDIVSIDEARNLPAQQTVAIPDRR
jgi:uncharacterized membrane protein YccF (DUF307 family)